MNKSKFRPLLPARAALVSRAVAAAFDVDFSQMLGPSRTKALSFPRQVAMALTLELTGASTTQIGKWFDRDHTTVMNARNVIHAKEISDPDIAATLASLRQSLNLTTNDPEIANLIEMIGDKVRKGVVERLRLLASRDPQDLAREFIPQLWSGQK